MDKARYIKRLKEYSAAYEETVSQRDSEALNAHADRAAERLELVREELNAMEQLPDSTDLTERRQQFEARLADTGERPE